MALTSVTTELKEVSEIMSGQDTVVWTLRGFDGAVELFAKDFSQDYKAGDSVSRIENGFIEEMQAYIDKWKREQFLEEHAHMASSLVTVQAALEV